MRVATQKQAFGGLDYHSIRMLVQSISSAQSHERLGNAESLHLNRMSVAVTGQPGTSITKLRCTNASYIQSPRLQTAVPIPVSENLVVRILDVSPKRYTMSISTLRLDWILG